MQLPLRTVCLSSSQLRGRLQQLASSAQYIKFTLLFSEREQVSLAGTTRDSSPSMLWATNWPYIGGNRGRLNALGRSLRSSRNQTQSTSSGVLAPAVRRQPPKPSGYVQSRFRLCGGDQIAFAKRSDIGCSRRFQTPVGFEFVSADWSTNPLLRT